MTAEAALLLHPSVRDCALLDATVPDGQPVRLAYVVVDGPLRPEKLEAHLRTRQVTGAELPDRYVSVGAIPVTDDGRLDEETLRAMPVIDDTVAGEWQAFLQGRAGVTEATVRIRPHPAHVPALHAADLIPGWQAADAPVEAATAHEDQSPGPTEGVPAIARGPELEWGDNPKTLAKALAAAAEDHSSLGLRYWDGSAFGIEETYPQLLDRGERIGAGLRAMNVRPGDPVILQLTANFVFIGAFWGCVAVGAIPVPVAVPVTYESDDAALMKLLNVRELLEGAWIAVDRAGEQALANVARREGITDLRVAEVSRLAAAAPGGWHEAEAGDVALMMLTSGTTGTPKAVMQSHHALISRGIATEAVNALSPDDITLNWMPLDHVAGLVYFHLRDVYLGCTQLHAPSAPVLQRPQQWLDWLEEHRVTVTFAPNFAYALVNDALADDASGSWDLSAVRYFMNGGEAVVASTARRFLELLHPSGLSENAMLPAWGMSETCSAVTFARNFTLAETSDGDPFVEVGDPIPGFAARIVDGSGGTVSGDTIGHLEVRGESVTSGYYRNDEATRASFTDDGWFRTGDLGRLTDGRLTITGRVKDVIIVNGINYYSHELEKSVDDVEGVSPTWSAVCAVRPHGVDTDRVAVFFHTDTEDDEDLAELLRDVRRSVARTSGLTPHYVIPVEMDDIPRTGIGKIQRPLLRARFESGGFEAELRRVEVLLGGRNTMPPWFYRPTWIRRDAAPTGSPWTDCLVLEGSGTLGEEVRRRMEERGVRVTGLRIGEGYGVLDEGCYQVDPGSAADYRRTLSEAFAEGAPDRVLMLWSEADLVEARASVDLAGSALLLMQSLNGAGGSGTRLIVGSREGLAPSGGDTVQDSSAMLSGLLRTAAAEFTSVSIGLVGLENDAPADALMRELESAGRDPECVWRSDGRWVRRLEQVQERTFASADPPFRRGGLYLITGGLGGIGREVARYLRDEHDAKLLLVGRRPLTGADPEGQEDHERARFLDSLDDSSGAVGYQQVDITDHDALASAVAAAEENASGGLAGILHLAGVFEERPLSEETPDGMHGASAAKVVGTRNLVRLVREKPDVAFIGFSSVNGYFGGYGAGSYSAANAWLERAVEGLILEGRDARYLAWSLWDEVGMSRDYALKHATVRRGFHVIPPAIGLDAFRAAVHSSERCLLIGLDGDNANVRPEVVPARPRTLRLDAYVSPSAKLGESAEARVIDEYGTEVDCTVHPLARMPDSLRSDSDELAPEAPDGIESRISEIWAGLLGVDGVGSGDNFFDLGADSVTMARARSGIQEVVGVPVGLAILYEYPTTRKLAGYLTSLGSETAVSDVDESDRRGADRRERMRQRRKRRRSGPDDDE